ncbi:MAG: hypothetical protein ACOYKN_20180 [Pirellula sp.]
MSRVFLTTLIVVCLDTLGWGAVIGPNTFPGRIAYCHHELPGYTVTSDAKWVGLSGLQPYLDVLNSAPVESQFTGNWNYVAGSNVVTGTLAINKYVPYDDDLKWEPFCHHGAEIDMSLSGLSGLPNGQQFQWMQYFSEFGDSGSRQNTIDPPSTATAPDHMPEDDLPFYYNNRESGWGGTTFYDRPGDCLNDYIPHFGSVSFVTFLSSWDGSDPIGNDPETVSIYGAVTWKYEYQCTVPEPSMMVIGSIFGIGGLFAKRRLKKQPV